MLIARLQRTVYLIEHLAQKWSNGILIFKTSPPKNPMFHPNNPPCYSSTHNRPTQDLILLFPSSPPPKPSETSCDPDIVWIMSSLLIKSPMAQWLRRPTVTTNSNREIRSSILRGGVPFLHLLLPVVRNARLASSTLRTFSRARCARCVAGATEYHILALFACFLAIFVLL